MKHKKIIVIALFLAAAVLTATTGVVFARGIQHGLPPFGSDNESDRAEYGFWGPMHGIGWRWDENGDAPPMRAAMIEALVEETELSEGEILSRHKDGETLHDIALDAGLTEEAYFDLMNSVREEMFSEDGSTWRIGHPRYQQFEGSLEETESEGFIPPCHGWDGAGAPGYGNPNSPRGRGRDW